MSTHIEQPTFGFIITRHVNNHISNCYWNNNVSLLNRYYPNTKIIIIDDNSNPQFIKAFKEYKNVEIIKSEFPKRGELLPFIYYLKNKWFDRAVIIHDSLFIHRYMNFNKINFPVIPLWHYPYDKENVFNVSRIAHVLTNNSNIKRKIQSNSANVLSLKSPDMFDLCFGCQCVITHGFLTLLEQKYKITRLISVIRNRTDRCALERIMGALFTDECAKLSACPSLFGNIMSAKKAFGYKYHDYINDLKHKRLRTNVVKVWSGR